jgi:hypothetical protein
MITRRSGIFSQMQDPVNKFPERAISSLPNGFVVCNPTHRLNGCRGASGQPGPEYFPHYPNVINIVPDVCDLIPAKPVFVEKCADVCMLVPDTETQWEHPELIAPAPDYWGIFTRNYSGIDTFLFQESDCHTVKY